MSADRTVRFGEWGCSKVRCDGHTDTHRCVEDVTGAFRKGIKDARQKADALGWRTRVRVQYAQNGFDWRDYCPKHTTSSPPEPSTNEGEQHE